MDISIKKNELISLLESFYELSQIRIVFFDRDFNELFCYPEKHSVFCSEMRKDEKFEKKCTQSAKSMCSMCKNEKKLVTEKCHAGLTEVVAPLTKDNIVMGYIMFGQIRSEKNTDEFIRIVKENLCTEGFCCSKGEKLAADVPYKTHRQIAAAAEIVNVFLSYIYLQEIVDIKKDGLAYTILSFIENNIAGNLSVNRICKEFFVSRTTLYELMKSYAPNGIAAYIKEKRIEKSKQLILSTNKSIEQISAEVGFGDSNYFRRVFKKRTGMSANKYRKALR